MKVKCKICGREFEIKNETKAEYVIHTELSSNKLKGYENNLLLHETCAECISEADWKKIDDDLLACYDEDELDEKLYHLVGQDGNAYFLMGYTSQSMRHEGFTEDEVKAMYADAQSSDYNHLICVCSDYIEKCNNRKKLSLWYKLKIE